jgi:hypothetical protein
MINVYRVTITATGMVAGNIKGMIELATVGFARTDTSLAIEKNS